MASTEECCKKGEISILKQLTATKNSYLATGTGVFQKQRKKIKFFGHCLFSGEAKALVTNYHGHP